MVGLFVGMSRVTGAKRLKGSHFDVTVLVYLVCECDGWKQNQAAREGGGI